MMGGPPTRPGGRGRRPVSRNGDDGPAQSNETAKLQDDEMGTGRDAGGQFETSFNINEA
jgi:hypothetical protein